ncbi:MAG: carbon-nitrogen hydrolase family protein [Pigmentiphaga sp.]
MTTKYSIDPEPLPRGGAGPFASYTAAVVQAAPVFLDLNASIDKANTLIAEAARQGASLVVFPELWLPGYPWWIWLDGPAWAMRNGYDLRYREQALVYGSPQAQRLAESARRHRVIVVMGLVEREAGTLYIAQWAIGPDGETLGTRRKLKPGAIERATFGEGGANDLPVWSTAAGNVGALCCAEHRHPLFRYALQQQGEQVHVAAWPSFSVYQPFATGVSASTNLTLSRSYAAEAGCYVLAACSVLPEAACAALCDTDAKRQWLMPGGGHSQIFGPDGSPLCEPLGEHTEGLLYANIEHARILAAKGAYDGIGHSHRPDVVGLWRAAACRPPSAPGTGDHAIPGTLGDQEPT